MNKLFFICGTISGFLSVAFGAFGAHALKARLAPEMLATFEVGARYQMYHAFALLATAWACDKWPGKFATWSGWLFISGTIFFSGSLYILTLTGQRWLGAVTPLGGMAFLAGWICLMLAAFQAKN